MSTIKPNFSDLREPLKQADTIINHGQELAEKAPLDENKNLSLDEKLASLKIDVTEELQPPQTAWGQIIKQKPDELTILGTLGNFSVIIGKAKSRKSFCVGIAIATAISDKLVLNQFKGELNPQSNKVLYFDTEQGKYHCQRALKRICKQVDIKEPDNLEFYGFRSKSPKERLELIEYAINKTDNLGLIVIDGIKDLITSINDEGEATMIASKLLKWTEEKNIHIITVLHQNKSDNNARGHIGTELMNKAETVLSVTKSDEDKDISIVEAQFCRNKEPEPFAFEIIEDVPTLVDDFELRTETKKNKFDVLDMEDYKKYGLLTEVFSKKDSHSYSELVIQLKIAFKNKFSKGIGDNRIKELITDCKNKDWLTQEKAKAPYKLAEYNQTDGIPF